MSTHIYSTSAHWQPALGTSGVVEGVYDVDQSIKIILTTPKGSDPLRPWFGCDNFDGLDGDPDVAAAQILRNSIDAITACEPRVKSMTVTATVLPAHTTIKVTYKLIDGVARETEIHV